MARRTHSLPVLSVLLAAVLIGTSLSAFLRAEPPAVGNAISGLVWRNIGPFRAGRVSAVTGVVGEPGTFYMGLPLGGVWKTTSAGRTWYPIFDDVKEASSVGSIEVAPSDPNVIYVGMGDMITGGGINEGNGMYKSTDAGKTWQHLGLDDTKQIPAILVDPKNPNIALIAAQGNVHTHTEMRGIFRTMDGGKTWTKTLYVDNETGGQDLAASFDKPNVVLAVTVRHYTAPGGAARAGGAPAAAGAPAAGRGAAPPAPNGTGLYKSVDQGVTWTEIKGHGLPEPLTGRMAVAVAPNTNAQRMFVIGGFGLYRSDDGGANWKQMAANDRRIANGQGNYTSGVFVDSKNPDIVYTLATSSYKSTDGGSTFTGFKGAPGGDDPQVMWIDPTDGQRLFLGVDQGATISLDGGKTWSSWYNQATEQFYHVATDNQFPYNVYGPMQDSGSIVTRSRGDLGAVTVIDWMPHPGYEFGSVVPDPLNPKITYAGGPSAGIIKVHATNNQWINVSPNFDQTAGLRKVGNQLLRFSPWNPKELIAGFNFLMATTDGGLHWKKLSPDLGYPTGQKPATPGGPTPTVTVTGAPPAGSIDSFSISTVANGTIWAGTNNGLIWLTKDHGVTWKEVTIPNLPNPTRMDVSTIEASHFDANTAYAAVEAHGAGDYAPYLYRTRDGGKTWTKIVNGLAVDQPSGSFARVIREDPKKKGLLFAGTESSMYVSFDDGDSWQSLQLNLPNTSYRDLEIHGNDLVAATYGRSFWILDDFSPLREIASMTPAETVRLFKPADAIRVRRNVNGDTPLPPEEPHAVNPPVGAILYYYLGAKPTGDITLEISDASGKVVRHMSSAPIPPVTDPQPIPDYWKEVPRPMPTAIGTNRINWDIRYDNPPAFSRSYEINANFGETPASPEGPLAAPGVYTLKLTVNGKAYTQTVLVKNDPRSPASATELTAQVAMQKALYDRVSTAWAGYQQVSTMRAVVTPLTKHANADIAKAATDFDTKLAAIGGPAGNAGRGGGGGAPGGAPVPPNFRTAHAAQLRQLNSLDTGDMAPNETATNVFNATCRDLKTLVTDWTSLNTKALRDLNTVLAKSNVPAVATAAPALTAPTCVEAPAKK